MSTVSPAIATPSATGLWQRYVQPADPARPNPVWHVSPLIDAAAYHFSWIWVLVPMLFAGPDMFRDYVYIFALVMAANLAHRHFGLPYAYLDGGVFRTYRQRLTWFPLVCLALLAATPVLGSEHLAGTLGGQVVSAILFFAILWNLWHTYMQKFGILRLYMAKDAAPPERKTPRWVDLAFIFCWFPLYFCYLGPTHQDLIYRAGHNVVHFTRPIIGFLEAYQGWLFVPSLLVAAAGVGAWIWHDWQAHRLRNRARLCAAVGMLMLSTSLFWADPVKAYIAFGFSHAVEYMVFVWAFQRRCYHQPRAEPPLLQKLLRHPGLWYSALIAMFGGAAMLEMLWARTLPRFTRTTFLGLTGAGWFFYYNVYESLVHFYMDGFLWKMRKTEVRQNI